MKALRANVVLVAAFAFAASAQAAMVNGVARSNNSTSARLAPYMSHSRASEIALARSAAPRSISSQAEIFVFTPTGYEVQSKGSNGFACLVERSWAKDPGDAEFWNAKVRAPTCFNSAAVRSILPSYLERTRWVLAGASEADIRSRIEQSAKSGRDAPPQTTAMSYMMSKAQYLSDNNGHPWHPHVMFYYSSSVASGSWGANLDGSPVISTTSPFDHVITFMVPVSHWSDGTPAESAGHSLAHRQQ